MTDSRLRTAQRLSSLGGLEERVRYLTERLRRDSGELRARIELAAYCSDEAAQHVLKPGATVYAPWCSCDIPGPGRSFHGDACEMRPWQFSRWVHGLSRWADIGPAPGWVLDTASRAAAGVVLALHRSECGLGLCEPRPCGHARAALAVLQLMDEWLAHPTAERLAAWSDSCWAALHLGPDDYVGLWLPWPEDSRGEGGSSRMTADRVQDAARLSGEAPVRAAIQKALTLWALGEDA